jgi:hypothetical protein
MAGTPSSAAVAASPPLIAGIITHSATAARRREAEVEARTCVNDLVRYNEFLREEECLVEHAKSLTAAVAAAHTDAEARNQEIYEQSRRFERGHLEWQMAFELGVDKGATATGAGFHFSSWSVGSSSSASY